MGEEKPVKRFEPINFMLVSGMLAILFAIVYSLYKYHRNIKNGTIIPASIGWYHWLVLGIGVAGILCLIFSFRYSDKQAFLKFRTYFAASFFVFLLFFLLMITAFPIWKVRADITAVELGYYYYGYISGYYSLFLLAGLVGQGVILSRVFRSISYIDSFIYSVNPPNILNMKLLVRYMIFVVALWALILFVLKIYAL